jgi:cytochrome oxidase Cu insertion factor (SCO1/SenC/PrrC family)
MLAVAGCGHGNPTSIASSFDGAVYPVGVKAPGFTLENQFGRRVSLSGFQGQVVVLSFVSTDCRACALVAQQVRGALDELANAPTYETGTAVPAMQVLFVSTDPHADTGANVRRFLAETSLSGRVLYLAGSQARLRSIWRAYRVPPPSAGKSASEAATTVLLIGRTGYERVAFGLEQLTPESLSHDIRLLRYGRTTPAG